MLLGEFNGRKMSLLSCNIYHRDELVCSVEYIKCKCIIREMDIYYVIFMEYIVTSLFWKKNAFGCMWLIMKNGEK